MAKKILRKFTISSARMFEESKTKRGFFLVDKAVFVAFDIDFDDPFAADWLTQITAAEAIPPDETIVDEITQQTAIVNEKLNDCLNKFQSSKYFIEKTFPDNQPVWNEFGYDNYLKVRKSQAKTIQFMKNFHKVATKYNVQLIAKGYSQAMIDEIKTLGDALDAANTDQEVFIGTQPVATQERTIAYNDVWDVMVNVCTAGKTIFKQNYAKYQLYLLPPGEEELEALSIVGTITDIANGNPVAGASVKIAALTIEVFTDANGQYQIGGLEDGTYLVEVSHADYTATNANITITDGQAVEKNFQLTHV